jgi:8-oxo-dGTP pyrophosphatase MutT (NUDIX family)
VVDERILNRLAERLAAALAPPAVVLVPFVVDGALVGELEPARVERLRAYGGVFSLACGTLSLADSLRECDARTAAMLEVARDLAARGDLTAWRDEMYPVSDAFGAPPLLLLERAAARYFGIATHAVHVNGTTLLADGREAMWLARRSATKSIDPGMLDNVVGGGVGAGADIRSTLVKEAWEEAGLPADVASTATAAGELRIRRLQPDGLQRETIFVHDLSLPVDVVPVNQDGEVAAFRLADAAEVAKLAGNTGGTDVVTADASLVIADWLLRRGHVPHGTRAWSALDRLRGRVAQTTRLAG